ncbi:hypothetical protein [Scytonema sp. NUACC26]|uniref:hypothetical protein n=1 Tax=Scytonema sp. NUACC26 TaxID=3140176 RepID=UPI0038B38471
MTSDHHFKAYDKLLCFLMKNSCRDVTLWKSSIALLELICYGWQSGTNQSLLEL